MTSGNYFWKQALRRTFDFLLSFSFTRFITDRVITGNKDSSQLRQGMTRNYLDGIIIVTEKEII